MTALPSYAPCVARTASTGLNSAAPTTATISTISAGPVMRPSSLVSALGCMASKLATATTATENTRRATSSEMPAGSSGCNISKEVDEVRGMAKHGPIAR